MSWFVQAHGREMPTDEKALDYIRKSIFSTTEKVIYGEVNGRLFACSPRYDEFAHEFERMAILNGKFWSYDQNKPLHDFILELEWQHQVVLSHWRKPHKNKSPRKKKREAEMRNEAGNPDVIRRHKGNPNSRKLPSMPREYEKASREIYGKSIDMNGKTVRMHGKMCEYLDGKTPVGYRPLNPTFPVPSGKTK